MAVELVAGDTLPSRLTYKIKGQPIDITGYTFIIKIGYSTPLVKQAVILDQTSNLGEFEFQWAAGDLRAGNWSFEILTRYPDLTEKTDRMSGMKIHPRIA